MDTINRNKKFIKKKWELVNFCEFDKYAIKSYCAIHNVDESLNLGDITKVDETKLKDFDFMAWGFPCVDISVAGNQKGFIDEDGNKTRSGLYFEGIRVLKYKKPKVSIIENVKNLVGKKFESLFEMILKDLDEAGYNSYYKVLNAKDYGVPQNRERVFIVSIRKDVDNGTFKFPESFDNGIRLKDILEDQVDEKYYVSEERVKKFLENLSNNIPTLKENKAESNSVMQIGSISDLKGSWKNPQVGRIYSADGCSPTLNTCGGGSHEPKILQMIDKNKGKIVTVECIGNINPSGKGMNGNVFHTNGLAPTLTTNKGEGNKIITFANNIRIRKLTPKECFRLMGFSDDDFERASSAVSNSQLYKQAGNSIVVDVLYYILVELYNAMPCLFDDLKLGSFFSGIGAFEIALNRLYEDINTENFINPQEG